MYWLVIQEDTRKGWFCRTRYAVLAFKNTSTAGSKNNPKSMTEGLWQWSSWDRLRRPDTCIADNNGLSLCWMWKRSSYCFLHSYREPERQVFICIIFYMSFSLSSLMFSLICRFLPKDKNYPYLTLRSIWCDTAVIQDVWHLYKDKGRKCFHDGITMRRKKTNPPQEMMIPVWW